jgi:hypothetical protein
MHNLCDLLLASFTAAAYKAAAPKFGTLRTSTVWPESIRRFASASVAPLSAEVVESSQ